MFAPRISLRNAKAQAVNAAGRGFPPISFIKIFRSEILF